MFQAGNKDFLSAVDEALAKCRAARVDCDIVQPLEPFLNMAGDDLRRRIFLTQSGSGEQLCLRPEFTIPVCLDHIANGSNNAKRYAYLGQVFRQRSEGKTEFYQAGIEDLGSTDLAASDANAISDALKLTAQFHVGDVDVVMGDQAVFATVLNVLDIPKGWQERLLHSFGNEKILTQILDELSNPKEDKSLSTKIQNLLDDGQIDGLVDHLSQVMGEYGYSGAASRSAQEIATRLMDKHQLSHVSLHADNLKILKEFLALRVSLVDAENALATFADKNQIKIPNMLRQFSNRVAALKNKNIDVTKIDYLASFGRPLDYYTGLVFEISNKANGEILSAGGRYDKLMELLGASSEIPAVGFSLWLDRFEVAK